MQWRQERLFPLFMKGVCITSARILGGAIASPTAVKRPITDAMRPGNILAKHQDMINANLRAMWRGNIAP